MSTTLEDFDDYIDGITAVIGEAQRLSRQISVQKAQCSKVIVLCHDVVNKLREAEDDPDVRVAMDRCNELVKALRSESAQWSQQLDTDARGLGLLLVPIIDQEIQAFVEKLLDFTKTFPSIFAAVQHKKWLADLDKSRVRDAASNKSQLRALVDAQDDVLVSALGNDGSRARLQIIAREFDILDDLNSIVPTPDSSDTTRTSQSLHIVDSSPQSTTILTPDILQQSAAPNDSPHRSYQSRQDSLDIIWSTISKLEEHVGGDPAFEVQMEQLRKIAQAAMISTDEAVGGKTRPNLLGHTAVIQSPVAAIPAKPSLEISLPSARVDLSLAQFTQNSLRIAPEPGLLTPNLRNTHVLEYIKQHPSSNRFQLCTGIGQGLAHMHSLDIVLGDFAPWNITVDESGNVRLRELNLSDSASGRPARGTWRSQLPDARYIPPEVITLPPGGEGGTDPNPRKSDVYAFTLLIYEILSGIAPWDKLDIPSIVSQVTRGNRPGRPSPSIWLDNDNFWTLLQEGWHQQPGNRPDMTLYAHNLEHWQHVLPKAQDDHIFDVTQQPTTPTTTKPFPFPQKPEDTDVMDDLSFDISREVKMVSSLYAPFAHGGFCDIFVGRRGLEKVAMKRLRIATIGDENIVRKRFIRECEVWRKLKHPNVLDIVKHSSSLFMISPFLDDGDAPSWLQNRCGDRLRVLLEAAQGCLYLHTLSPKPTVHGDIKGANILIKANGQAVLSDFGLSKTMNARTSHGLKDTGTGPYMAPELFAHCNDPDIEIDATTVPVTKTLATDVFAFGRTAIELLSGQTPYGNAAATPAIWYILLQGKRPSRPTTPSAERWITDAMWAFINEMTHVQPECRPTMHEVVARLERFCLELDPSYHAQSPELEEEYAAGPNTNDDAENDDGMEEEDFQYPNSFDQIRGRNTRPPGNAQAKGILKQASQATASLKPSRTVQFANDTATTVD